MQNGQGSDFLAVFTYLKGKALLLIVMLLSE